MQDCLFSLVIALLKFLTSNHRDEILEDNEDIYEKCKDEINKDLAEFFNILKTSLDQICDGYAEELLCRLTNFITQEDSLKNLKGCLLFILFFLCKVFLFL